MGMKMGAGVDENICLRIHTESTNRDKKNRIPFKNSEIVILRRSPGLLGYSSHPMAVYTLSRTQRQLYTPSPADIITIQDGLMTSAMLTCEPPQDPAYPYKHESHPLHH